MKGEGPSLKTSGALTRASAPGYERTTCDADGPKGALFRLLHRGAQAGEDGVDGVSHRFHHRHVRAPRTDRPSPARIIVEGSGASLGGGVSGGGSTGPGGSTGGTGVCPSAISTWAPMLPALLMP